MSNCKLVDEILLALRKENTVYDVQSIVCSIFTSTRLCIASGINNELTILLIVNEAIYKYYFYTQDDLDSETLTQIGAMEAVWELMGSTIVKQILNINTNNKSSLSDSYLKPINSFCKRCCSRLRKFISCGKIKK
jgi:hypothetical protein